MHDIVFLAVGYALPFLFLLMDRVCWFESFLLLQAMEFMINWLVEGGHVLLFVYSFARSQN